MISTVRTTAALALAISLCAAPARAQSVTSLFTSLPADFAHLFTPTNGIIVGVGGAGSAAIHPKDEEIAQHIYEPSGGRHDFFRAGASVGDGIEQGAFALGTYVVGRIWTKPRIAAAGAELIDIDLRLLNEHDAGESDQYGGPNFQRGPFAQ